MSVRSNRTENILPSTNIKDYAVHIHVIPKHPKYITYESRIDSYNNENICDSTFPISIKELAKCGLFYFGIADLVKCFFCNIGLYHWEIGDDPWVEHAKYAPDCAFVKTNKSRVFIDYCKQLPEKEFICSTYGVKCSPNSTEETNKIEEWKKSD